MNAIRIVERGKRADVLCFERNSEVYDPENRTYAVQIRNRDGSCIHIECLDQMGAGILKEVIERVIRRV